MDIHFFFKRQVSRGIGQLRNPHHRSFQILARMWAIDFEKVVGFLNFWIFLAYETLSSCVLERPCVARGWGTTMLWYRDWRKKKKRNSDSSSRTHSMTSMVGSLKQTCSRSACSLSCHVKNSRLVDRKNKRKENFTKGACEVKQAVKRERIASNRDAANEASLFTITQYTQTFLSYFYPENQNH